MDNLIGFKSLSIRNTKSIVFLILFLNALLFSTNSIAQCNVSFSSITTVETCINTNTLITINGLAPNSVSTVNYTKAGIVQTPATVNADAFGVGNFSVMATASGQIVIITAIIRIDVVPNCTLTPTGNNVVALIINPGCTNVQNAQCGNVLLAIDSYIYANLVASANSYRWRVTTLSGPTAGQIQYATTALRNLKITQLPSSAFDTQYKVEVATSQNGIWSPYGKVCNVSTPPAITQLTLCGEQPQLNAMSDIIYANALPFVTGYKFRISDPFDPTIQEEMIRNLREFRMSLITAFSVQFNKLYNVEVSVRSIDGTYLPYGPICTVRTPMFATTSVQDSQCDDYQIPNNNTVIYADSYPGVLLYAFKVTGPGLPSYGVTVLKPLRIFSLHDFPPLQPGTLYDVRVRLIFNTSDVAGPYGKTCSFITPSLSSKNQIAAVPFDVVAYPNPFSDSVEIGITSALQTPATLKIYDLTGRLLEVRELQPSGMKNLQIGTNFPTGIYTVTVTQGENLKTLRVVKR